jgi:hypothetical protein
MSEDLKTMQKATGHFVDGECPKCSTQFSINTRYPQKHCVGLVDHKYCMGEIVLKIEQNGCRKCGAEMLPSKAIVNKMTGRADFIGSKDVVTMSLDPRQPVLVDCLKCSKCGWSVSL